MFDENKNQLLSANQVASLRIFIAAIVLTPISIKGLKKINQKQIIWFFLVGMLGNLLPAFLFTNAEKDLSSSFTGILNSLVPIFSVIASVFLFNKRIKTKTIYGVLIGFIGTVLLILFMESDFSKIAIIPILMVVLATICYAISLNIIKEKLESVNSIEIASISLLLMIPGCIVMSLLDSQSVSEIFEVKNHMALLYTSLLAILGTSIALIIFNNLIKTSSTAFASSVTYLIPFVAITWGIIFKEDMSWSMLFILVILLGIYLIKRSESRA